jgi:hypothetical protein
MAVIFLNGLTSLRLEGEGEGEGIVAAVAVEVHQLVGGAVVLHLETPVLYVLNAKSQGITHGNVLGDNELIFVMLIIRDRYEIRGINKCNIKYCITFISSLLFLENKNN